MLPLVNGCLRKVDASLPSVSTTSPTDLHVTHESARSSANDQRVFKCMMVGDGFVGKTSLILSLHRLYEKQTDYEATSVDLCGSIFRTEKYEPHVLRIFDSAGQEEYNRLRPLNYEGVDVFLLCFSVDNVASFHNVEDRWLPELRYHPCAPTDAPFILVACKTDLRYDHKVVSRMEKLGQAPVSMKEGIVLAQKSGARAYVETSSLHNHNVNDLFRQAFALCVKKYHAELLRGKGSFFGHLRPTTTTQSGERGRRSRSRARRLLNRLKMIPVQGKFCLFSVYVQGCLEDRNGKTFILTVHDVGANHKSLIRFVDDPSMEEVKENTIFLHVCLPGQEDNAPDYKGEYPTLDQIGEDLVCVLEKFEVRTCIALGEGAGANVIRRFAIYWPNHIMGIILVNCISNTAGFMEIFKDKLANLRLENDVMSDGVWDYLAARKRSYVVDKKEQQHYIRELKATMNPKNISKYLLSYCKRTDISAQIGDRLDTIDVLLVAGAKAPFINAVHQMHKTMNKKKTTLLVVDDVSDVAVEAPDKLARGLILLCKGCGLLPHVAMPGMQRQKTLSSSMEAADRPQGQPIAAAAK
ncbi:Ndr [Aphelenchoides avenae]|nr:Ndr [Aphelenchus avenae]